VKSAGAKPLDASSVGDAATAPSALVGSASAAGAASRAGGGVRTAAGSSLGSGEYKDGDDAGNAGGVDGAVSASASTQGTQPPLQAQINLALAEGSDATGATASALQAANAAASAAPAPVQSIPGIVAATVGGGTVASVSAPPSVSTVLSSDGPSHAHGESNDSGAGLGGNGGLGADAGTAGDGAAALQQLSGAPAASSSDASRGATLHVNAPVDSADFAQSVADRVSFAVDNNWGSTKLQVNPPQLGPIDLQISVQGDHAQVMMSTHSAVTREALESSLPKLKDMLSSQGFTQVSVDISQRSFQDRSAFSQPYTWAKSGSQSSSVAAAVPAPSPSSAGSRSAGVLDAYA
jgi:flagellar hook-length control protein FliK